MVDKASTKHRTENETEDNGCVTKLTNIFKKRLKQDTVTPINGPEQENKNRLKRPENALFTYFENLKTNNKTPTADEMLKYVKQGANINYQNEKGNNILHEVCLLSEKECSSLEKIFSKLITIHAELKENLYGQTVLHLAAYCNNIKLVKYIIDKEDKETEPKLIHKETYEEKQTALHYAAKQGNTEIVKILLEKGAEIEAKDFISRTPNFLACEYGKSETVEFLLKKGARVEVTNKHGQKCLYWLIAKCPELASDVLDKYIEFDVYTKKDTYYLKCVELDPSHVDEKTYNDSQIKSILTLIVETNNLDLIVHPVIVRLIKVKWEDFTRFRSLIDLALTFVNILIWNLIGALCGPFDQRYLYRFPQDGWRVFLFVAGSLGMIVLVFIEFFELYKISKYNKRVSNHRIREMSDYGKFLHCQPGQRNFCEEEKEAVSKKKLLRPYFRDFWNWFDIISICLLITCVVTHIVDIGYHNENIARTHIRVLSISVVFISLRLLKVGRYLNQEFGQLVMTLYFVIFDILTWLIIFVTFWIPFSSAFWMLFGGEQSAFIDSDNTTVTINGLDSYNNTVFHLFRETFGSDIDRDDMIKSDSIVTDPLIGIYLGVTTLIAVNVFIAQLTATFNRVHEKSKAYFLVQRAIQVLSTEHSMKIGKYKKHLERLQGNEKDKNIRKKNLNHNMDEQTKDLIRDTIKAMQEKAENLNNKINDLTNQFEKYIEKKPSDKIESFSNDIKELKNLLSDFFKTKNHSNIKQSAPRVDVLRSNEINENEINLEQILSPINNNDDDSSSV